MRFKIFSFITFFILLGLLFTSIDQVNYWDVVSFTLLALIASASPLYVRELSVSLLLPVLLPTMVFLPPGWVGLVAIIGSIQLSQKKWPVSFFLFARTSVGLPAFLGSVLFHLVCPTFAYNWITLVGMIIAYMCYEFFNILIYSIGLLVKTGKIPTDTATHLFTVVRNSPLPFSLALVSTLVFDVNPLLFATGILLFVLNKDKFRAMLINEQLYPQIITAMVKVLENADSYTKGHSLRVAEYAVLIGKQLHMRPWDLERLKLIATLHDLGKQSVPGDVIRKIDKLTEDEYNLIKKHAHAGEEILKDISLFKEEELRAIREHHEWFDGRGYPDCLKGSDICLWARIIAVADAFDAMTSERPYRETWNVGRALAELSKCSGTQFDPEIVSLFLRALQSVNPEEYINETALLSAVS